MNPQIIGAEIRRCRRLRGISLPDLAVRAGVSKGNLSKIESGGGNPTVETLVKIFRVMGMGIKIGSNPK